MRVVSWNMGCGMGSYRLQHAEAWGYLLDKLQPDVALLQETLLTPPSLASGRGHLIARGAWDGHEELGFRNLPCVAGVVAEAPQWCTRSRAISAYGQTNSERVQEGQELFLLLLPQIREPALRIGCLAAVAENGVPQGQRLPVMHEPTVSPHTPERRGPKPGSGHLVLRLHVHE